MDVEAFRRQPFELSHDLAAKGLGDADDAIEPMCSALLSGDLSVSRKPCRR
jgi:hypothetical protein